MNGFFKEDGINENISKGYVDKGFELKTDKTEFNAYKAETATPIVCFTFDDGYEQDALTYSILKEFGFAGCFGVITDNIYASTRNPIGNYALYEKEGFELLSHSATHADLNAVTTDRVTNHELKDSAEKLRGLGFSINGFVAPMSNISAINLAYAKTIYDYVLIGGTGLNGKGDFKNKTLTRVSQYTQGIEGSKTLIDQAISDNKVLVFYDHRIGYTGALTELQFREILTYLKTKTDANLIKVMNVKNAVSKYYGASINNRSSEGRYVASKLIDQGYSIASTGVVATTTFTTNGKYRYRKIAIPTAVIGNIASIESTYVLPTSLSAIGEQVEINLVLRGSNTQYDRFTTSLVVSFLDVNDVELHSETRIINPDLSYKTIKEVLYIPVGLTLDNVKKIKHTLVFDVVSDTTVAQNFELLSCNLVFPNSNGVTNLDLVEVVGITASYNAVSQDIEKIWVNNIVGLTVTRLPLTSECIGGEITYVVQDAGGLNILPVATEQIRGTNAINEYITSSTVGDCITFICVVVGFWEIKSKNGTWAFQV